MMEKILEVKAFCKKKVWEKLENQVDGIKDYLQAASAKGSAAHEVEENIWRMVLAMGYQALGWFLAQQGAGDVGETMVLENQQAVKKLEQQKQRTYRSIFGTYELSRYVYGSREGQKIEFVPLDTRLKLPAGEYSYVLQEWSQMLAVESPYKKVSDVLEKMLALNIPVDSLERINREMSEAVAQYRVDKPIPPKAEEGELLVSGGDGKGVPIRHARDKARIYDHRRQTGPKPDRKRMAIVGTAYSVDRYIRTPESVVEALFRKPDVEQATKPDRPRPQHKQVFAQLTQAHGGVEIKATAVVFNWMNQQLTQRDADNTKAHIVLMDGQPSLWEAAQEHFSGDRIEILDLLHATPRLWDAAAIFHHDDAAKLAFIYQRILRILRGEVSLVIRGLRQMATKGAISAAKRKDLEKICGYLAKNKHRMQYDKYLAAGYPIASGVLEGACRHFVKDRMERAGMRWSIDGAQSMLDLRSTYLNGDWEDFVKYRIKREEDKLYPYAQIIDDVPWPISA